MTLSRFDDGTLWHPKMLDAGEDATNLWIRSVMYANRYGTDGLIRAGALAGFTSKPPRVVSALVARLVSAKLWDVVDETTWRIHDFLDWNTSRAERESVSDRLHAERSRAGKAGNAKRWGSKQDGIANRSQTDRKPIATCESQKSQTIAPVPVPVPVPVPSLPTVENSEPPSIPPSKPGGKRARSADSRRRDTDESALPFRIADALAAVETASGGRFAVPIGAEFDRRHASPLVEMIRTHPALIEWTTLGEWLTSWRSDAPVSVGWLLRNRDAFALSRAWRAAKPATVDDPDDPWAAAERYQRSLASGGAS